jgi:hypothetical protein
MLGGMKTSGPPNYSGKHRSTGAQVGRPKGDGTCPRCQVAKRVPGWSYCRPCKAAMKVEKYKEKTNALNTGSEPT